ncbi:hypothetical protein [Pseudomonas sp. GV071]|uniref:hypothetical protein n=1 Tax=Pseudomonas sp. GV071 TaxID=2135754 RepID=UPI000D33B87D|nr:hypothetical protein [Pseudomonas sp. GV071]PTQ66783.1 hypothetical protein C8K61_11955 [Pseudomonas sp. GV071]
MPGVNWFFRFAAAPMPLLLASCASVGIGAPTGWVAKDPATSTGTFYYGDGGRYEGGYSGEKFQGRGTLFYEYSRAHQGYTDTNDPPQLRNGQLAGEFSNGQLLHTTVTYTTEWNNNATYTPPGAFAYKGGYDGGFKGKGRVIFKDGRIFKGQFGNEPTLFSYAPGERVMFATSQLVGSYFEGTGTMRWSNGATFEGVVYRYYLFDRDRGMINPDNLTCVSSAFYGKGVLKEPGKADYVGLVGETYEHTAPVHANEADFMRYADELAQCPGTLAVARDRINGIQSELDTEMAQGRANAQAMLAADLGNLANQVSTSAARIDAASRGTTYEIEQAKQQRNADYASFISAQDADPASERSQRQTQAAQAAKAPASVSQAKSNKAARSVASEATAVAQSDEAGAAEQAAQQAAGERLEHEKTVQRTMDDIERKRVAAAEVAKKKAEKEAEARQLAQSKKLYLAQLRDSTKLAARTCPGGEGKYYVVGLKPAIKPAPVECLDVAYTARCPGSQQGATGVIKTFLGASTDCFMGDTAEIAPQLSCKASEVVVKVNEVSECSF